MPIAAFLGAFSSPSAAPSAGWVNMPPGSGTFDVQDFGNVNQYRAALRERAGAVNNDTGWPAGSHTWETGTVTSISVDPGDPTRLRIYDTAVAAPGWIDGSAVKRWTDFMGFFDGVDLEDYAPTDYKIVVYKKDETSGGAVTELSEPRLHFSYVIWDNGDDYVQVIDDGELTLNDGLELTDFADGTWAYAIIRWGGAGTTQAGYSWPERHPQPPNDAEVDYGAIDGEEGVPPTTTTIADTRVDSDEFNCPKSWAIDEHLERQVIFQVNGAWRRADITGNTENTLTFGAQSAPPSGNYWIVENGAYWRPAYRLTLEKVYTRSGREWVRAGNAPWAVVGWYGSLVFAESVFSHRPSDDTVAEYGGLFVESITLQMQGAPLVAPAAQTFDVFDVTDARTTYLDYNGNADHLFNPYIIRGWRGLQVAAEELASNFIEPISYDGRTAIPNFTTATWFKYHTPANTVTTTITTADPGGSSAATIDTITLPQITPQAGLYTSLACTWAVLDEDDVIDSGSGTVTATTLTRDDGEFIEHIHEDMSVVISFDWTRKYPRAFKYLYPRRWFMPGEDLEGGLATDPTEQFPGEYESQSPSTNYAEFDKYGELDESGAAFVTGESARYVADNWDDPTRSMDPVDDISSWYEGRYQGFPNVVEVSDFPRWEGGDRSGQISAAGSFWIEDQNRVWWAGTLPVVTHTGTGTSGSNTTELHDSALYKAWPTLVSDGMGGFITDMQVRLSNFWQSNGGQRFVKMILEVEVTDGNWERRPITAQDISDDTDPFVTVSPAFSGTTLGRPYQIRECADNGSMAISNTWEGRRLRVTRATGSGECAITHSDDTRLYFAEDALGFTPAVGDRYEIIQIEPGAVLQRKATTNAHNGWTLPEDATQDTRGKAWHLGDGGPYENLPTVVNAYGRLRKGDYHTLYLHEQMYAGIDALRWTQHSHLWTSLSENNHRDGSGGGEFSDGPGPPSVWWGDTVDQMQADWATGATNVPTGVPHAYGTYGSNHDWDGTEYSAPGASASMESQYMYGEVSGVPTVFNHAADWYAHAVIAPGDPEEGVTGDPRDGHRRR
jgi:hypothetical protein